MSRMRRAFERLQNAAGRVPLLPSPYPLEAPTFGPGCCAGELEELQAAFRHPLPSDYTEFLGMCRRVVAADVFNGYYLYSPLRLSLPGTDNAAPGRLHVGSEPHLEEVWVFAVGGDGSGNQFIMGCGAARHGHVWKWSHEAEVRFDGVASQGLTHLSDSFSGLLERMADDWEHFCTHDRTWQYMSG